MPLPEAIPCGHFVVAAVLERGHDAAADTGHFLLDLVNAHEHRVGQQPDLRPLLLLLGPPLALLREPPPEDQAAWAGDGEPASRVEQGLALWQVGAGDGGDQQPEREPAPQRLAQGDALQRGRAGCRVPGAPDAAEPD